MTDYNQFHDSFADVPPPAKKMPDMINVLTILTFIWSAYELFSSFLGYSMICNKDLAGDQERLSNSPFAKFFENMAASLARQCEMRLPILIIHIITIALCFVGALQMRKMKKTGFYLYLVGELGMPLALMLIVGGWMAAAGLFFPIIFVILYATQLKHMK